ncbi:hypothetical protein [Psychrobacillus soli]|uniref:Uncharacterized protein n=1 Tax=Psychrobacillus soli TaxID=1543965 RepID=A0A544T4G1_9BACI|nr:hypothetical protein [Psychrobacillus soli]TQR12306.1 hypothetical protein FG383_13610 [Psychrobacillus soli]
MWEILKARDSGHLVLTPIFWTEDTKVIRYEKNNIKYVEISEHQGLDSEIYIPHMYYIILREENGNYKVDDIRRVIDESVNQ